MKVYIRSMSEYQSKIYDDIVGHSKQIDQHIIRLLLYPQYEHPDHWIHEIWANLYAVDKLKGSNKYPKASFIYKALSVHNDILYNYVKIVKSIERDLAPISVDTDVIVDIVNKYQHWLAIKLSTEGVVLEEDVKAELMSILNDRG